MDVRSLDYITDETLLITCAYIFLINYKLINATAGSVNVLDYKHCILLNI